MSSRLWDRPTDFASKRRRRPALESLEDRSLLAATVGLISANVAGTDSVKGGALFPSISADGRYEVFESGSFSGTTLPAPSDLVNGLTVANDAPNVYLRDRLTGTTTCLSVNASGHVTGDDASRYPVISANGRFVVFVSDATDLVPLDNNGDNPQHRQNVFVRDVQNNTTTLASVNFHGTGPATNTDASAFDTSRNPSISADGRYVAFESDAVDLVPNDSNGRTDVFVRDLQTNTTVLVSANAAGADGGDAPSNNPVISADGGAVAFDSLADALDPTYHGPTPFTGYQIYVRNLQTHATRLASIDPAGLNVGNSDSIFASLSADGKRVAFQSGAGNLVNTPKTVGLGLPDVYVRDLATNATQLVSLNASGTAGGDSTSFAPDISGDGNHVVFSSLANDLTTNDHHGTGFSSKDVFERNLLTNTTQLISVNAAATNSGDDASDLANQTFVNSVQQSSGMVSSDGRYVIFISRATDLVPGFVKRNDPTFGYDLYLRDTVAGTTTLISHQLGTTASGGDQTSGTAAMTPDGRYVAFQSTANDLVSKDTNGGVNQTDVFVSPADYQPVGPGSVQFGTATYSVTIAGAAATVTVTRTNGSTGAVSVQYAAGDGTAAAGTDYTAAAGTLNFADGQTTASFTVPILNDAKPDGAETVNLTLSNPLGGASLGTQTTAVLTIDPSPRAPGDFDADGRTDPGVFRQNTSQFFIQQTTAGLLTPVPAFGAPRLSDIPLTGDFDGVGHAEIAVFRPSTSQWFVVGPGGGHLVGTFGAPNLADVPVPGDYDGVGHTQLAVFRPSTSQWFVVGPTGGHLVGTFGAPNFGDVPAPGDYDGVGHTQLAVFRPSTSQWFVVGPAGGHLLITLGAANYIDVPIEAPVGALKRLGLTGHSSAFSTRQGGLATGQAPGTETRSALARTSAGTDAPGRVFFPRRGWLFAPRNTVPRVAPLTPFGHHRPRPV